MGNQQFTNLATALLASTISNTATTLSVAAGAGALFPNPTGGQYFMICVEDTSGDVEIMKVTGRSTDSMTVVRGQESTTALGFTANLARVEMRETAGTFGNFLQKNGDTLTGALNLGAQTVTNGTLGSGISLESCTEIVNTPIRGATGVTGNQIVVPTDGSSRATAGGAKILCVGDSIQAFTIGQIMLWFGAIGNIPQYWSLCNGQTVTNSQGQMIATPDLQDVFVVGAGNLYALSQTGGATSNTPTVTISGSTDGTALTIAQIPSHTHLFYTSLAAAATGGGIQIYSPTYSTPPAAYQLNQQGGTQINQSTGSGATHSHTLSAVTGTVSAVPTLPPYYGLYYIMYTG